MSIAVMSAVWKDGPEDQGELLVMLALADHCDDFGVCFPSMARIGRKARMSERNARRVVRKLEADGFLAVEANAGPRGCNLYRINRAKIAPDSKSTPDNLSARTDCPPDKCDRGGGHSYVRGGADIAMSGEPSSNHHREPSCGISKNSADEVPEKSKRGSRLPEDWTPSEQNIEYAQEQGLTNDQIRKAGADFADYWIAKIGEAARKIDWDRTWQMWVRNVAERSGRSGSAASMGRKSGSERARSSADSYVSGRVS